MKLRHRYLAITICTLFCHCAVVGQNLDADLMRSINTNRNKSLDGFFTFVTNTECPVSIGAPVITLSAGFITKDKKLQRKGWENLASFTVSYIASSRLKKLFDRERPAVKYNFVDPYSNVTQNSFPSGHTTFAFSTATSLSINFKRWYVVVPAYLWAGAMGFSRIHLGVHYPSDVLAGAILGTGSAWFTHKASNWLHKKKNRKKPLPNTVF